VGGSRQQASRAASDSLAYDLRMPAYQFRAAFRSSDNNQLQDEVNVLHFEVAKLTSPFDAADAANEIDTRLGTEYRAMMVDFATWHDLTVTNVTPGEASPTVHVKTKEVAGTRAGSDGKLDAGLCAVISLNTGIAKRYARGRIFAPPAFVSSAVAEKGTWSTSNAYWTALQAFATKMTSAWTAGDDTFVPIVFSTRRVAQAATPYSFQVTGARVSPDQHFLRSRSR
jgi:hypothetical protein